MISYGERATQSLNFQVEHAALTLTSFAVPPGGASVRCGSPAVLTWV